MSILPRVPREQTEEQTVGDLVDSRSATAEELDRIRRLIGEIEGERIHNRS